MYENIEKFYIENHYKLIEDKSDGSLRPGKSFTKDVENCIEKFRTFYKIQRKDIFSEEDLMSIINGVDTNTRSQNLRVMREFGFLNEIVNETCVNDKFEFTQLFKDFALSDQITGVYILDELYKISGLKDFSMYFNLLICTLREAAIYGQVVLFPDADDKFKNAVPDKDKRNEYRKRIYDVYGYSGRKKEIADDEYTPNLSYMSRAELENLGLLRAANKVDGLNSLILTGSGHRLLRQLDKNLVSDKQEEDILQEIPSIEQKERFRAWMYQQKKPGGDSYSNNTITSYISQMERGYNSFDKYKDCESVFQIQDRASLDEYTNYLLNADGFAEFNDKAGNKACSCGLIKYREFLLDTKFPRKVKYECLNNNKMPRNRIVFGAPGTGKSSLINTESKKIIADSTNYERVTFHPDYTYANFVGTYKPVSRENNDGTNEITYEYVPGPFMRLYVNSLKSGLTDTPKPFILIIEEINRANVAAVFGDVFQLLDRDSSGVSEYPIQPSEEMKKYLVEKLGVDPKECNEIRIPNNMFIWATMNSADQGVFPMDTAFRRRWDFEYIDIDANEDVIKDCTFELNGTEYNWNALRKAINRKLTDLGVNEDKLLGPFFIRKDVLPEKREGHDFAAESVRFNAVFKDKVLMYLFSDAARQRNGIWKASTKRRYSELCKAFDESALDIFDTSVTSYYQEYNS